MKTWLGALAAAISLVPGVLLAESSLFPRFTSDDFKTLLHDHDIQSIPELVLSLPEHVKGNLTFLFESFSAQRAHLVFNDDQGEHSGVGSPRAILWDTQGRFFLTYNGFEKALGYNTVETMEYEESSRYPSFKFVSHVFPSRDKPGFSKISERVCQDCHGERSRPIWGEYPKWDNAYGSREDIVQPGEAANFARFKMLASKNDLYKDLLPSDAWENYPYKKDEDIRVMSESHTFRYRPNTRMSILLNRLNANRIFAILKSQPRYKSDRSRLASQFLGCAKDNSGIDLIRQYGLSLRDLDLRYTYNDPRYEQMDFSDSYFDGASTTNELLAAAILSELSEDVPQLKPLVHFKSLVRLYPSYYHRTEDAQFMAGADSLGLWIRTPFPQWQVKGKFRPKPTPVEADNVRRLCRELSEKVS
jgi:hypothetical protein